LQILKLGILKRCFNTVIVRLNLLQTTKLHLIIPNLTNLCYIN